MDRLILAEKLEALRRCLQRVEAKRAETADALRRDPDRQDIVSLNLARAVQLCVDMATHVLVDTSQPAPQTMGEAFDDLAAASSRGRRSRPWRSRDGAGDGEAVAGLPRRLRRLAMTGCLR